ncbi:hypothetical protein [Parabacteroides distasonis]|jgi:hypothetical protein|uniref:hypothetical protein n=1 Tax=Parabacteroides distasonis TaxID=823 RepID=UPI00189EBAFF|nr:hypothetical protein [Parabacteroides distasonis]MDB9153492.1 hypothetical protein [Parabacteroides distasonis]MDB9158064.1 hypothetical protein [Parabacteroides distasonis]MDB9166878.1 hypothetical protein [Parabacteroides distasonis]MDB9171348.1 hypothetical protein [Parabacteroides distasonis]
MRISIELNSSNLDRLKQFMADKLSAEEEYKIISEGAVDAVSYDAKLSETNSWLISIAISVFSPFVTDVIRDFVDYCKTEISVITENERYVINAGNLDAIIPELKEDIETELSIEQDVKDGGI